MLRKISIRTRLLLSFLVIIFLTLAVGITGYLGLTLIMLGLASLSLIASFVLALVVAQSIEAGHEIERSEAASKAKSDFLTVISYELRTHMNAIAGLTEMLLMKNLSREVHGDIQDIKEASTSLINIINDILDFSKIEAGKVKIEPYRSPVPSYKSSITKSPEQLIIPGVRILVVDDIHINLKVAEGALAPYRARVDTCLSGPEAIEKLQTQEYDLVFMDHMMPDMDGIETVSIIRNLKGDRYKTIPIVALTANAMAGMKEMFLEKGFNDFLPKPIDIVQLNEILIRWIPKKEQITSDLIDDLIDL